MASGSSPTLRRKRLRAVVTGGAAGIGRAVAERLAADGAAVMIVDVNAADGQRVADRLGARFVAADLSALSDVRQMMAAAGSELGGLDILVNNAGGLVAPAYPDADADHWLRMVDLNLRGVMLVTQLAIDAMGPGGAIVNIASTAGLGHAPHRAPEYAVAKAGVIRLTSCLSPLRESHGVRVNCVCPGLTDTPAWRRDLAAMAPAQRAEAPPAMPAGQVADAVMLMLTDENLAGRVMVCQHDQPAWLLPTLSLPDYLGALPVEVVPNASYRTPA